jgi:hypothetical protein
LPFLGAGSSSRLSPEPVTFFGPPDGRAVCIAIDDGWFPSE